MSNPNRIAPDFSVGILPICLGVLGFFLTVYSAIHALNLPADTVQILTWGSGAVAFGMLVAALRFHVRAMLEFPLDDLREKVASMQRSPLLEQQLDLKSPERIVSAFDELEQNFLQVLSQLQTEHREALEAKKTLATVSSSLASELRNRQRLLDDDLARALTKSRLAALGDMAGGIAHEINNPLAILVGRMAQLRSFTEALPGDLAPMTNVIGSMENNIDRIQELITDLETLAHHHSSEEVTPVRFPKLLRRVYEVALNHFAPRGLRIDLSLLTEAEVPAREVELTQALLYLLENAAEASLLTTSPWVRIELSALNDSHVILRIVDSGPGMGKDVKDKIFQPFFTTKEVGKGRGVGLSLAQSIILGHQGQVYFDESAPNTTVCVELPRNKSSERAA